MFPNESKNYREARNKLLDLEIQARRANEAAARARRELPLGGKAPEDFVFQECDANGLIRNVRLSELFAPHSPTLAIYSYMYGSQRTEPCPMCTGILDGLNGVFRHIQQRAAFVVVAQSPAPRLFQWAQERGWQLRLLSAAGNSYNQTYNPKSSADGDTPGFNVFAKKPDGIYHTYASEPMKPDPGQDDRGLDGLNPIFNFFDMTPEGRGVFYTKLHYPHPAPPPDRTKEGALIPDAARPGASL